MADPEFNIDNSCISAIQCSERSAEPIQLESSDIGAEQIVSSTQMYDVQTTLNVSDISLTNQNKLGDETNTRSELLHGNGNEHTEIDSNAEVKCVQGEILIINIPTEGDKKADSQTVGQTKHSDTTPRAKEKQCAETTSQETTSAEIEQEITYSLQEYKFENSIQITSAWNEFKKKEDICMRGCKWYVYLKLQVVLFCVESVCYVEFTVPCSQKSIYKWTDSTQQHSDCVFVTLTDVIHSLIYCIALVQFNMLILIMSEVIS
jgi:hypothetical protein